ncbi:MAG: hypothetical protein RLZ07_579 [Pseudomonadota bacterium]
MNFAFYWQSIPTIESLIDFLSVIIVSLSESETQTTQ